MEELAYQIKNGNGKIGEQGKILLKAELYPCYLDLKEYSNETWLLLYSRHKGEN